MDNLDRTRTQRRRRWTALILLLGLAAWIGWGWFTRPETLRLVRTISLERGAYLALNDDLTPALFGAQGGLLLRRSGRQPDGSATLTLIGWEGQPRWSVTLPRCGRKCMSEYLDDLSPTLPAVALSPDGQVFALAQDAGAHLLVTSWRNGQRLGQARVPRGLFPNRSLVLRPTNSGRLWIFNDLAVHTAAPSFPLCAVDGARVATGRFTPALSGKTPSHTPCRLSPGGTRLLTYNNDRLELATLAVRDGCVTATKDASHPLARGSLFDWLDEAWVMGRHFDTPGTAWDALLLHPDGTWQRLPRQEGRLRLTARGRIWSVTTNRKAHFWWYTTTPSAAPDGRAVLVREGRLCLSPKLQRLQRHRAVRWFLNLARPRLALYTAPGRLRAVGPASIFASHGSFVTRLSPDGRHVAICDNDRIRVYTWEND